MQNTFNWTVKLEINDQICNINYIQNVQCLYVLYFGHIFIEMAKYSMYSQYPNKLASTWNYITYQAKYLEIIGNYHIVATY